MSHVASRARLAEGEHSSPPSEQEALRRLLSFRDERGRLAYLDRENVSIRPPAAVEIGFGMKQRSQLLAVLALLFFSLPAAAQARGVSRTKPTTATPSFGSYERTKLLTKGCKRGSQEVLQLGAADRRALLTTGKSVYKPERRTRR